jgi:hypothetical protein
LSSIDTAALMLTHVIHPRIVRHFERLKSQTDGILDAFLCVDGRHAKSGADITGADYVISEEHARSFLPRRFEQYLARGGVLVPGFVDMALVSAILARPFAQYRFIWLVEYDVDFAGDWSTFFRQFIGNESDLLGTALFPRSQSVKWLHWSWFKAPVAEHQHYRAFLPIVRFSQRILSCYREAMETGCWEGHSEAIWPTIANAYGLPMQDIGGLGPETPVPLRGRNYSHYHNIEDGDLSNGTLVCRPVSRLTYFHETPEQFSDAGYLHHPVKSDWTQL